MPLVGAGTPLVSDLPTRSSGLPARIASYYTKLGNINPSIRSAARLQKLKQNHKFSVLSVMSENELLFPVSTPQLLFELPK